MTFRKQPIIAGDEIKVNVILTTKYKVKAKNFIIPIFYFPVSFLLYIVCCNTSIFSFFILISFLFEDFFKASKEQETINKWYMKFDILASQKYSAASNSKEVSGDKIFPELNFSPKWTKPVTLKLQSCKLCNSKYMIASIQITTTEIFAFIAVVVFNSLIRKSLFKKQKRQQKLLKSRLLFKKIANFTGKLLQNHK